MSLELSNSLHGDAQVVAAVGRVDSSNAAAFETAALGAVNAGAGALIFDLKNLVYMSSAGLRVLLVALKACKSQGRPVGLAGVQANVSKVLEMSGFAAMFTLGQDVGSTVDAVA